MVSMLSLIVVTASATARPLSWIDCPVKARESGFQRSNREREGSTGQKIPSKLPARSESVTS